jgi:hypothetical protein
VVRLGGAVIAMELAALGVAYVGFGWLVLLVGAPVVLGTVLVLAFVGMSEKPRQMLHEHRAQRWDPRQAVAGGLMSGFFTPVPSGEDRSGR